MNILTKLFRATVAGVILCACFVPAQAQLRPPFRTGSQISFQRDWDLSLDDATKLIEIGRVTDAKRNSLLMVTDGRDRNDSHRRLHIAHWDGLHFSVDYETDFLGTQSDALLAGHFRLVTTPAPAQTVNSKTRPAPEPPDQIITTEGVYVWNGKGLLRLFTAPPNLMLAMVRDTPPDLLVTGVGNEASAHEIVDTEVRTSNSPPPIDGPGYVRFGAGTQDFEGAAAMTLGTNIRYAQSYWSGRSKWLLGVVKGSPAGTQDNPNNTTGDRFVVFMLRAPRKDLSFWASKPGDFEEVWRSEALPGKILDIRVGDPKNEGKDGILVLTSENSGKNHRLYFYTLANSTGR